MNNPKALVDWDTMFRRNVFSTLMADGLAGHFNGVPQGGPAGVLYKEAMASHNATFKQEFGDLYQDNPDFIITIFGQGG